MRTIRATTARIVRNDQQFSFFQAFAQYKYNSHIPSRFCYDKAMQSLNVNSRKSRIHAYFRAAT
ncbi:hypothetical protein DXT88_20060 [Herbaspirillum lusitanum]|nr:hypothetical protein [Herbaspirillum lusitanum]